MCVTLYSDGVVYVFYSMVWYVVRYRIVRARVYVIRGFDASFLNRDSQRPRGGGILSSCATVAGTKKSERTFHDF